MVTAMSLARGEGAQCVLDAIAQLTRDLFGNVDRVLRDKIDADTFGPYQADHLFDLVLQSFGCFVEQQMLTCLSEPVQLAANKRVST